MSAYGSVNCFTFLFHRQSFQFTHPCITGTAELVPVILRQTQLSSFFVDVREGSLDHLIRIRDEFQLTAVDLFPSLTDVFQHLVAVGYAIRHSADGRRASEGHIRAGSDGISADRK